MKPITFLKILRPINGIMVGLGVIIGYLITVKTFTEIDISTCILGFLTGFLVSGSIMVLNDIIDYEIDKINQPERPLPSGKISINEAWFLAIFAAFLGFLTSFFTGITTFLIAILFWIIGVSYNKFFKGTPLIGNLLVSLSISIPFIYGGLLYTDSLLDLNIFFLSSSAFSINTYREIIKDILDLEGDRAKNLKTLPIKFGIKSSILVATIFMITGLVIGLLPLVIDTGLHKLVYAVLIALTELTIFYSWILTIKYIHVKDIVWKAKNLCLVGMLLGMLAFMLSKIVLIW